MLDACEQQCGCGDHCEHADSAVDRSGLHMAIPWASVAAVMACCDVFESMCDGECECGCCMGGRH